MKQEKKTLLIPKIEHGIVIDHIPAGWGLKLLEIIHSYPQMTEVVGTVGLNYTSEKLGRKDMIKLTCDNLTEPILQHVSMACPGVTIKRVKDFKVEHKFVAEVPETLLGQVRCRNPNCITNNERDVVTRFRRSDPRGERFQCAFCERIFPLSELEFIVP